MMPILLHKYLSGEKKMKMISIMISKWILILHYANFFGGMDRCEKIMICFEICRFMIQHIKLTNMI